MKLIPVRDAVGHVLCHDMTQIIPGQYKDARFRKGHVVREEDIPVLLSMGKENLYVWELVPGMVHEDEAAARLCALCRNEHMEQSAVKEGKLELTAAIDGLFRVDARRLREINLLGDIMIATRHGDTPVRRGDKLCGTRVIPLVIAEEQLVRAEAVGAGRPLLEILPWKLKTAGIVTTGSEVYHGRIQDAFGPVLRKKLAFYGAEVLGQAIVDDDVEMIRGAIQGFLDQGAELVVCSGGMSVDPDDLTPTAIQAVGGEIVSYGAPVLPGAMFLLSYTGEDVPVLGLPGCVMYHDATIFDLVLPRIMAGERLAKGDLAVLGHGGLCLQCPDCHYPDCGFGKGGVL